MQQVLKKGFSILAWSAPALVASAASGALYNGVGTYDSTSNANTVDFSAAFASATGVASTLSINNPNLTDVSTFTGAVSLAFTNGMGAVNNIDALDTGTGVDAAVGVKFDGGDKQVFATNTVSDGWVRSNNASRTPISGTFFLNKNTINDYNFTIGNVIGGDPDEHVVQVGLTLLSRAPSSGSSNLGTVSVTATFANDANPNAGTITSSRVISEAIAAGDTFYGFIAPAGHWITNISVDVGDATRFTGLDDLGIITAVVPEPGSLGILGLGGLVFLRRRTRET